MVRNDDRENKRFGSELLKKRKTKKKSKKWKTRKTQFGASRFGKTKINCIPVHLNTC
jgi:hypothetical protein